MNNSTGQELKDGGTNFFKLSEINRKIRLHLADV